MGPNQSIEIIDAKIGSTMPLKTLSPANRYGANTGPALCQGLCFLWADGLLAAHVQLKVVSGTNCGGHLVAETYRKNRNGKLQTEGLPHSCREVELPTGCRSSLPHTAGGHTSDQSAGRGTQSATLDRTANRVALTEARRHQNAVAGVGSVANWLLTHRVR